VVVGSKFSLCPMTTSLLTRSWAAMAAAFCLMSATLLAADSASPSALGPQVGTVPVPAGYSAAQVKEVVAQCFLAREWEVKIKADDRVVGYLNHRGVEATMTVQIDGPQLTFFCDGWKVDKAGKRIKPEDPKTWIANMKKDVTRRLLTPPAAK
jgi:hypothetical protein